MITFLAEVASTSTKGIEYVIALVGLVLFLFFLRLLRPPSQKRR